MKTISRLRKLLQNLTQTYSSYSIMSSSVKSLYDILDSCNDPLAGMLDIMQEKEQNVIRRALNLRQHLRVRVHDLMQYQEQPSDYKVV
jgi:hypothetical protein